MTLAAVLTIASGIALGLAFYGGLWLTVRRLPAARHPALLALASFWMRTISVIAVVLLIVPRGWPACAELLCGFVLGRILVSVLVRQGRPLVKCA